MPFAIPRPLEDDAWLAYYGVAHFYGWSTDFDGTPKCSTPDLPAAHARRAADDDLICRDCEGWYHFNVTMPWLA